MYIEYASLSLYICIHMYIYIYYECVCVWFIWFAWALHSFDFVYDSYNWLATSTNLMMFTLRKKSIQRGSLIATSDYTRADMISSRERILFIKGVENKQELTCPGAISPGNAVVLSPVQHSTTNQSS